MTIQKERHSSNEQRGNRGRLKWREERGNWREGVTFIVEVELVVESGRLVELVFIAKVTEELLSDMGLSLLIALNDCLLAADDFSHLSY